ncbi:MAG TPA: transposase [Terriglobia bacterium]|nr:transposase [Terriglobia bacterium]
MSHVHRLRTSDRIFFVTVNLRRQTNPLERAEYAELISALQGARRRLGFLLCGYVLMPDHWHALIGLGYPLSISDVIHDVKKVSARRFHGRRGAQGPLWQHQFWDRFVRHGKEFADRLTYMHLNPVRKGLAANPEDWPWSSYNNFALDASRVEGCPIQIDYVRLPEGYRG